MENSSFVINVELVVVGLYSVDCTIWTLAKNHVKTHILSTESKSMQATSQKRYKVLKWEWRCSFQGGRHKIF